MFSEDAEITQATQQWGQFQQHILNVMKNSAFEAGVRSGHLDSNMGKQ